MFALWLSCSLELVHGYYPPLKRSSVILKNNNNLTHNSCNTDEIKAEFLQ